MEWGEAKNFIWLWVLPAAVTVYFFSSFRRRAELAKFGDVPLVERLIASFNPGRRLAKRICLLLGLLFVILALCQPHFRTREITMERKGVDVMIVVDVSKSMLAKDVAPNRLEKAKLELTGLIERLKEDRIGIVAFAGEAYIQCPLTVDKNAAKLFLSTLSPSLIPTPGTLIGSAIRVASQAFAEKDKEYKAIILLTDGEDQGSNPMQAVARAKAQGIKIFTIGFGTADGSTIPGDSTGEGFKKDRSGQVVLSKLDENLLKKIAKETGGVYYRSSRGEVEADALVREIRQMSQKGFKSEKLIEYEENYQYFLALALLFLMVEMVLSERKAQRDG